MKLFVQALFAFFLIVTVCAGETVIVKDGAAITGTIVMEKDDYVIVDLGFTGLTVKREDIVEIVRDQKDLKQEPQAIDINEVEAEAESISTNGGRLYYTGDRDFMSIEDCVEHSSESVVLVSHAGGLGSGFFINEGGYLITNYHVIEGETKISITVFKKTVTGFDKVKFKKVRIVSINPYYDLALLKVEDLGDTRISYVRFGDNDDLHVGQKVFAIGNPLGLERSVHDGIVSTKNRAFEGLVYLQTNTDINPGNSGGPLFNLRCEVVGVTNMGYIFMGGLGFAIPVNYVKDFLDNHEAFAYDADAPNTGFRYLQPDGKIEPDKTQN